MYSLVLRGIYYENWHAAGTPTRERHASEFADHVSSELSRQFPLEPLTAVRGVFEILWEKLDPGEFEKLMHHLPVQVRELRS